MTSTRHSGPRRPETDYTFRRTYTITLNACDLPDLPPLICRGWEVRFNPDFSYWKFELSDDSYSLAECWEVAYGMVGQERDLLAATKEKTIRMYRPLCTWLDERFIHFHTLNRRK